jgi:hypothetical protein
MSRSQKPGRTVPVDERFRVVLAVSTTGALEVSGQAHPCISSTWLLILRIRRSHPGTGWPSDRSQPAYQKVLERNPGGGVGSGRKCS